MGLVFCEQKERERAGNLKEKRRKVGKKRLTVEERRERDVCGLV